MPKPDFRALLIAVLELDEAAADEDIQAAADEKIAEMAEAESPESPEATEEAPEEEPTPAPAARPKRKAPTGSKAMRVLGYDE